MGLTWLKRSARVQVQKVSITTKNSENTPTPSPKPLTLERGGKMPPNAEPPPLPLINNHTPTHPPPSPSVLPEIKSTEIVSERIQKLNFTVYKWYWWRWTEASENFGSLLNRLIKENVYCPSQYWSKLVNLCPVSDLKPLLCSLLQKVATNIAGRMCIAQDVYDKYTFTPELVQVTVLPTLT